MAELVDAPDLKSGDRIGRAGSIPAPGTTKLVRFIWQFNYISEAESENIYFAFCLFT